MEHVQLDPEGPEGGRVAGGGEHVLTALAGEAEYEVHHEAYPALLQGAAGGLELGVREAAVEALSAALTLTASAAP